jgi:hypothetical protein
MNEMLKDTLNFLITAGLVLALSSAIMICISMWQAKEIDKDE